MITFIDKNDFVSPYPYLSKNLGENEITNFIYKTQNERLRELLGDDLYNEINNDFQQSFVVTAITQGVTTLITLDTTSNLQIDNFVSFADIQGTASLLNAKDFQIISIVSNTIEINFNSTGLTYTTGGKVIKKRTPLNKALLDTCKPFLIYGSYAKYLPYSNLKSTNSGLMVHSVDEANAPSQKDLGILSNFESVSADYAEKTIVEYLRKNKLLYPLYKQDLQGQSNSNILPLFSNTFRFDSGSIV